MTYEENYLAHYGVKGMKWGVRRYENLDGTLTPEGRRQRGIGEGRPQGPAEAKKGRFRASIRKMLNKGRPVKELSDQELQERINRMQKEKQYKDLEAQLKAKPNNGNQDKPGPIKQFLNDTLVKPTSNVLGSTLQRRVGTKLKENEERRKNEKEAREEELKAQKAAAEKEAAEREERDTAKKALKVQDIMSPQTLSTKTKSIFGKKREYEQIDAQDIKDKGQKMVVGFTSDERKPAPEHEPYKAEQQKFAEEMVRKAKEKRPNKENPVKNVIDSFKKKGSDHSDANEYRDRLDKIRDVWGKAFTDAGSQSSISKLGGKGATTLLNMINTGALSAISNSLASAARSDSFSVSTASSLIEKFGSTASSAASSSINFDSLLKRYL